MMDVFLFISSVILLAFGIALIESFMNYLSIHMGNQGFYIRTFRITLRLVLTLSWIAIWYLRMQFLGCPALPYSLVIGMLIGYSERFHLYRRS